MDSQSLGSTKGNSVRFGISCMAYQSSAIRSCSPSAKASACARMRSTASGVPAFFQRLPKFMLEDAFGGIRTAQKRNTREFCAHPGTLRIAFSRPNARIRMRDDLKWHLPLTPLAKSRELTSAVKLVKRAGPKSSALFAVDKCTYSGQKCMRIHRAGVPKARSAWYQVVHG